MWEFCIWVTVRSFGFNHICMFTFCFLFVLPTTIWIKMAEVVHMIDSEVFLAFSTYATIVILKMMLMSLMTSYFRLTKQVHYILCSIIYSLYKLHYIWTLNFHRFNDSSFRFLQTLRTPPWWRPQKTGRNWSGLIRMWKECDGKLINCFMTRSLGERWRCYWCCLFLMPLFLNHRCHQNDLENIVPFLVVGLLYALTGPDLSTALLHFRVFVGSRIIHTVTYVMALPQPSRGLAFGVGLIATLSMAYRVLTTALFL